jgi:large subunit ribosomal protein L10
MALTKQQKADLIAQYTETLAQEGALVLLEQRGLPVDGVVSFKKELATTSGTSRVVKKRLLLQTAEKNGFDAVDLGVLQWSLVAVSTGLEDFSPLKVVLKMNKLFKKEGQQYWYSFLWWWYGKSWKDASYVSELASIPSKEELIGKFLYLLKYPMQSTAAVLDQIAKKKAE